MISLFDKSGLSSTYSVSYTNSNENDSKGLKEWIKVNEANAKRTNIIIAVKQLSVGVTLPSCDMVLHWNDGRSLAEYIQRSERCKNPKESTDQVYVVDFNPHRCIQCHGEIIEAITGSPLSVTSITKYLANMNILIYEGEDAYKNIEPFELLDTFIKYNYPLLNFGKLEFDNEIPENLYSLTFYNALNNRVKIIFDKNLSNDLTNQFKQEIFIQLDFEDIIKSKDTLNQLLYSDYRLSNKYEDLLKKLSFYNLFSKIILDESTKKR
jgi:hypothetical protein